MKYIHTISVQIFVNWFVTTTFYLEFAIWILQQVKRKAQQIHKIILKMANEQSCDFEWK